MLEKVSNKQLLFVVGIGLALCVLFGWFGERKTIAVHSNASGTIRVGDGLEQAHGNQQKLEERIGNASARVERIESSLGDSQGRIGNAQTRAGNIESLIVESEHIAETDQRILHEIKKRATTGNSSQDK